jgi:hypothetical protein
LAHGRSSEAEGATASIAGRRREPHLRHHLQAGGLLLLSVGLHRRAGFLESLPLDLARTIRGFLLAFLGLLVGTALLAATE